MNRASERDLFGSDDCDSPADDVVEPLPVVLDSDDLALWKLHKGVLAGLKEEVLVRVLVEDIRVDRRRALGV